MSRLSLIEFELRVHRLEIDLLELRLRMLEARLGSARPRTLGELEAMTR